MGKDRRVHTTNVLETLQAAMDAMLDQETGVRGYLITADENFLEPYHRGSKAYISALEKVKTLTSSPAQQSQLDELDALAMNWHSGFAQRAIALMAKPQTRADARALEGSTAGKTAMDLVRAKVDEIEDVERDLLARRDAVQRQAFATAYMVTILGGAGSLMIAVLMGLLLTRGIAVPITRMTSAMTNLAKGDTTIEVPGAGRSDEIGAMGAAVQVFKDSMMERERVQAELAHANRVATMGQLTASIAHEINQPIAAAVTNAGAALRFLNVQPADLDEVRQALGQIVADGNRASDVIGRIRALVRKVPPSKAPFDVNEAVLGVITLNSRRIAETSRLAKDAARGALAAH